VEDWLCLQPDMVNQCRTSSFRIHFLLKENVHESFLPQVSHMVVGAIFREDIGRWLGFS